MADHQGDNPLPFKGADPLKLDWSPYTMPTLQEIEAARRAQLQDNNRQLWNSGKPERTHSPAWDFQKDNTTRFPHAADKATTFEVGKGLRLGLTLQSSEQTRPDALGQVLEEAIPRKPPSGLGISGATIVIQKRF